MASGDDELAANKHPELSFVEDVQASQVPQRDAKSSFADSDIVGAIIDEPDGRRRIGLFTMIALCFNICSSWAGLSTSIQIALLQGGPVTLIYGTILITAIYLCISLLIAELGGVYPTAGVFQWVSSGAAVMVITATQIMALVGYFKPGAQGEAWQLFLIYQAIGVLALFYNLLILNRLPMTHTIGFTLSIAIFLTTFIGILSRASPGATHEFVWTAFINQTGWPDGVCFLAGLITPAFMYGGLDGALHLSEEAKNPQKIVPRACVGVIMVGFCTAFPFGIVLLYSISDFQTIIKSSGFVPFEINAQGLRSGTAAAALLCAGCVLGFFILNALLQSSSRLVWSFARDDGFAFSHIIRRVHPVLKVPVWATFLNWFLLALCGFLILVSSIAFNAILSSSAVHQLLGIWIPIVLLMYRRRSEKYLPKSREFAIPQVLGWALTIFVVLVIPVLVVCFALPPFRPVTWSNLNYTPVVLGFVGILGLVNWVAYAHRHFKGPRIELEDRPLYGLEVRVE